MRFKSIGELFEGSDGISEVWKGTFKGVKSLNDNNIYRELLESQFKFVDGKSQLTTDQIELKSKYMGLTDELKNELLASSKYADFMDKATSGTLTFSDALKETNIDVKELGRSFLKLDKVDEDAKDRVKAALDAGELKDAEEIIRNTISASSDLGDEMFNLEGRATSSVSGITDTFKGMLVTLKSVAPYIAIAAAAFVAFEAVDNYVHRYTNAMKEAGEAATEYAETKSHLEGLGSEYEKNAERIKELNKLKANDSFTMAQEVELTNLENQNASLERQIELQEELAKLKGQASAKAAVKAANTEKSYIEQQQEEHGTILGWFTGIAGMIDHDALYVAQTGMAPPYHGETLTGVEYAKRDTSIAGRVKSYINEIEGLNDQLESIDSKIKSGNYDDSSLLSLKKQRDDIEDQLLNVKFALDDEASALQGYIDQSTNDSGIAVEGYAKSVDEWNGLLNDIHNVGKEQIDKDLNNLNTFFRRSGNSSIERYLKGVAREAKDSGKALEKFKSLGFDLSDINVSESGFKRYFNDVIKSAEESADAINSVSGTIESVKAAFETANNDANWTIMADFLDKAKELREQGKVGTDDFKTATQFLSPTVIDADAGFEFDADAYVAMWDAQAAKIDRYFNKEDQLASMQNVLDDLVSSGLAIKDGNTFNWTEQFDSSADAAKSFGLSVEAAETLLHSLEAYGFEFDAIEWNGENLKEFEASLSKIKELRDSLTDGKTKAKLDVLIENWDEEYAKYQNDMSLLTEDQLVQIKFEYDLATLQAEAERIRDLIKNGDASKENYAQLIVTNEGIVDSYKSSLGIDKKGVQIPVEYTLVDDSINELRNKLAEVTSDEERLEIQAEIVNLQSTQQELLQLFHETHPEITAKSSFKEE